MNQLVLQAQRGSEEAANQLYPLIEDLFHYHARRLMRGFPSGIVDEFDLTQEALMKVVRRLSQYHGDSTGEFASWLRSILRSALVDLMRNSRSSRKGISLDDLSFAFQPPFSFNDDQDSPEAEAIRNEEELLFFTSALFLPEQDCNIVLLRFWDGLPYKEIGRRVHCSPDAARMRFRRSIDESHCFGNERSEALAATTTPKVGKCPFLQHNLWLSYREP
jgi:RNA polymerase sigma-70 factor (ECF subfamily)